LNPASLLSLLSHVTRHPLNKGGRVRALGRFLRWQLASRLGIGAIALPFVNGTRLLATSGMTGATGNWYCGLHEHDDMGFALHFLRATDCFFDIGANVGSYTVLAAGAAGARVVAVEPIPVTFRALQANVRLNDLGDRVLLRNVGLGAEAGTVRFTQDRDAMNRALLPGETVASAIDVAVVTLDSIADPVVPTLMKLDVEGYEARVLAGGERTLRSETLRCMLMEMNGSGRRFGVADQAMHAQMRDFGFAPACYDVLARSITALPVDSWNHGGNTLYVRDIGECRQRVRGAGRFKLVNRDI
jgi:FkbM family methyltransferase